MASVDLEIAGRKYNIACRDGEEDHLRQVAAIVDRKAQDATQALGSLGEARQLLFACLLLADELQGSDGKAKATPARAPAEPAPAPAPTAADNDELAEALEWLAAKLEGLAGRLEARA